MTKSCNNCIFAYFQDHGYSNWTVEGTEFTCLQKAHRTGNYDRFYGEAKELEFANKCPKYSYGEPIHIDVEGEEPEPTESSHGKEVFELWKKNS